MKLTIESEKEEDGRWLAEVLELSCVCQVLQIGQGIQVFSFPLPLS
jgi:hypothetical protein